MPRPPVLPRRPLHVWLWHTLLSLFLKLTWTILFHILIHLPPFRRRLPRPTTKIRLPSSPYFAPAHVYFPPDLSRPAPLLVTVHGGSFLYGHPMKDAAVNARLARGSVIVVGLSYSSYPFARYPAPARQVRAQIRELRDAPQLRGRVDWDAGIVVLGWSAGGCLVAEILHAQDQDMPHIKAAVLGYPKLDFTLTMQEQLAGVPVNKVLPGARWLGDVIWYAYCPVGVSLREVGGGRAAVPCFVIAGDEDAVCEEDVRWWEANAAGAEDGVEECEDWSLRRRGEWSCLVVKGVGHAFLHQVPRGKAMVAERVLGMVVGWIEDRWGRHSEGHDSLAPYSDDVGV